MNALRRFGTFLQDIREEIRLVSWPTRDELIGATLVVFVGVALMATYISACDFVLSKAAHLLLR